MAIVSSQSDAPARTEKKLKYFRRTPRATWVLTAVCLIVAALTPSDSESIESFRNFGYGMAGLFFLWGLDAHLRVRRMC